MDSAEDLYSIIIKANITNLSPQKLEKYLSPILEQNKLVKAHEKLSSRHLIYDRKFFRITE